MHNALSIYPTTLPTVRPCFLPYHLILHNSVFNRPVVGKTTLLRQKS